MHLTNLIASLAIVCLSAGCKPTARPPEQQPAVEMQLTGMLSSTDIDEASGMQASYGRPGDYFVHNDDGETAIYAIDKKGTDLGMVSLVPAKNHDWEDITSVPVGTARWLVLGDIGDNLARRSYISLYFAREPAPGKHDRYSGILALEHRLDLTYPDGPRDSESLAYDPVSKRLLILSQRDKPAHLYALDLAAALTQSQLELTFLGTIATLRPPSIEDRTIWDGRADWISQPTGLDIAADGSEAIVVTYRSLYRFVRQGDENWLQALRRQPQEVVGPPGPQNEAVAYSTDGHAVFVTSENLPAMIYRFRFNP